jgi:protein-L-isoaspartate(D-aspartate) O-methyltransferase
MTHPNLLDSSKQLGPHMHAHVLEEILASLQQSTSSMFNILDVRSRDLATLLRAWVNGFILPKPMLGKFGKVYGIDVWPELIEKCQKNLDAFNAALTKEGTVKIALGDGWKGIEGEQFDAIHVGAAASTFPSDLMMQLKVGAS